MQIILAIAAICQIHGVGRYYVPEKDQIVCQKQLAKCAVKRKINTPDTLRDIEQMLICVRDRK